MLHPGKLCFVFILAFLAGLVFLEPLPAFAQGGASPLSSAEIQNGMDRPVTVLISVRERTGIPLSVNAIVRLSPLIGGQSLVAPTTDAATASFPGVHGGEYEVQVEAAGYERTTERISVSAGSTFTAYVYVSPLGSSSAGSSAPAGTVMTPDLQRELDKSLFALRQSKYEEARKHLEKAHKMAPSNPDVLYLMGMIDYTAKDIPAARKQFQSVLASYPSHQRSLIMLGQIQLDSGENNDACLTLQKAVEVASVNWQSHYLLAIAYARTGEIEKARVEAQRTAELNKGKQPAMKMLEAKLLLMQGRNVEARKAFEAFLHDYPQGPAAAEATQYLAKIDEQAKASVVAVNAPPSASPFHASTGDSDVSSKSSGAFEKPWAPADVDAGIPPVAPGAACSIEEVLKKTQKRILSQLSDLEKFGATEKVEHQFVDQFGVPEAPLTHEFDYLIFVHHTPQLPYYFDEVRDGAESLYDFPSPLVTRGLVSLGFMVIHPVFSKDFQFFCEGLGTWNGHPAWQIHFVQRPDVPSRIRSWNYKKVVYPIPLKGRIWIGANNYNLLHLETALRNPVPDLRLDREQLIVDYGPVHFLNGKINLWLPWHAEMYFDMQGRRYHHRHTLTNYVLFDVDTQDKIKAPPIPRETDESKSN
jgi:TolA-binding protein